MCVTFTHTLPVITCSDLVRPYNGMILFYSGGSPGSRPVGTVSTYACDTGYTLDGGSTRTCQGDGTWSGSAPTCESKE